MRARVRRFATGEEAISVISYGEVIDGALGASEPAAALADVQELMRAFILVGVDAAVAETFGRLRNSLRRGGARLEDCDLLIAATALSVGLTLVTRNVRHFERITGLSLLDPTAGSG